MSKKDDYNVIFIMADQMKATASRLYSEIGVETPNLKRMKENGVQFENTVTPHPLCVPARTSVMSSKYPHTCLLYTSPSPRDATLSRMPSSA